MLKFPIYLGPAIQCPNSKDRPKHCFQLVIFMVPDTDVATIVPDADQFLFLWMLLGYCFRQTVLWILLG